MSRRELTDAQWHRIEPLIPGTDRTRGRNGRDNRLFVDGILWLARTGSHWRELPPEFGRWNSIYQRFNRWCRSQVWENLFHALRDDPDFEYVLVDSTIVRAHQHAAGAQKKGLKLRRWGARKED